MLRLLEEKEERNVELTSQLTSLKKKAMKKIGEAAGEHDISRIRVLSEIANKIEGDLTHLTAIEERVNSYEKELAHSTHLPSSPSNLKDILKDITENIKRVSPSRSQRRQMGQNARNRFVELGSRVGFRLIPLGGKAYRTTSGKKIGVTFANELEGKPDRWWLGIKDEHYDVVVLLCNQGSGSMLDFILPYEEIKEIWPSLSRSAGEVKFNIIREGETYSLLVPPQRRESISRFLGKYGPLK